MKSLKRSNQDQSSAPLLESPRRRTFRTLTSNVDAATSLGFVLKRNPLLRKMNTEISNSSHTALKILNRNPKTLKRVNLSLRSYHPGIEKLKKAKGIKGIQVLDGNYSGNSPTFLPPIAQRKLFGNIVNAIFRGALQLESLGLNLLSYEKLKKKYQYHLQKIQTIFIEIYHNFSGRVLPNQFYFAQLTMVDAQIPALFENPQRFPHLAHVKLEFGNYSHEQDLFCQVFEHVSHLSSLVSLEILMNVQHLGQKDVKLTKKMLEKFTNLRALTLILNFNPLPGSGNLFSSLSHLKNLSYLDLQILSSTTFDCSDLAKLISSMKKLNELKLLFSYLVFGEYANVLKEVQKLKNLKKLSVCQKDVGMIPTFAFGLITKTIQTLKNLESVHINLGIYVQTPKEMPAFLQCFVKHPNLKKAIIALVCDPKETGSYDLDEDFYGDILQLLGKLERLHITLANFPQSAENKIVRLFLDSQKDSQQHTYFIRPWAPYRYVDAGNPLHKFKTLSHELNVEM